MKYEFISSERGIKSAMQISCDFTVKPLVKKTKNQGVLTMFHFTWNQSVAVLVKISNINI